MKRLVLVFIAMLTGSMGSAAEPRPYGVNCSLSRPPSESGEEGGHGFVLLVFPRTGAIGPSYSGCQAVFTTSPGQGTRFAWVVEVSRGDPIRMWSADNEMADVLPCRYRNRQLLRGDPNVCPRPESLLLPTQAAGCFTGKSEDSTCQYDVE